MKALYKKEVKGFLTSMVGYVFIAFLLVISGIYFTAYHLQSAYPYFSYTLQSVLFVFLIAVPVLTMRVLAEERKQKTDQLLLTAPVSVGAIVLGKYLALVSIYLIPVAILAVYPLVLSQFGTIAYAQAYTALFGFFLMGCCYLAIGLYLSSVTESQVIAAVLTFLVLFVCYVMDGIASFFPETSGPSYYALALLAVLLALLIYQMVNKAVIAAVFGGVMEAALLVLYLVKPSIYEGLIQKFLGIFNITDHFSEFSSGIFDVQGLAYYLAIIVIFLFLTVQSIQKKRWGERRLKNGSYSMVITAVVIACALGVNLIVSELPSKYTQIDLTDQQLATLTSQSEEILSGLTRDVTLYYIVQDSTRDTNISRLLERYSDFSHVTVEEKDPVISPNFTSQYTDSSVTDNSVIVTCGDSSRVVSYETMYETEFNYSYYTYETTGFDGEGQITSAIAAVSSDSLPKLYALTGHNEMTLNDSIAQSIEKENIQVDSLNLVTADQVPEDADCLLIASPAKDLSSAEKTKILNYLRTGGRMIVVTDYTTEEMPNLSDILEYYGVSYVEGAVMEGDSNYFIQVPYYLVPNINDTSVSSDMADGNSYVLLAAAQGLQISEEPREGVTVSSILSTSDSAYSKVNVRNMTTYEKESGDIDGPFDLGVLVTETVKLTEELLEEVNASQEALLSDTLSGGLETDAEIESEAADPESETKDLAQDLTSVQTAESEAVTEGLAQDLTSVETAESEAVTEGLAQDLTPVQTTESEAVTEDLAQDLASVETEESEADSEDLAQDLTPIETAETRLAVYSSSMLLDASADSMVSGGNSKLFINTLSWLCGHDSSVSVPVKSLSVDYLTLTSASSSFWSILVIGIIPGAILIGGLMIWLKRRKL